MKRAGSPLRAGAGRLSSPLVSFTLTCGTLLLVLAIAHFALGSSAAGSVSGGGSARSRVRLLLQGSLATGEGSHGPRVEPGLHAEVDPEQQGGDGGDASSSSGSTSNSSAGSTSSSDGSNSGSSGPQGGTASSDYGPAVDPAAVAAVVPSLTAAADLATFAAPGTHCVVTPTHPKVALMFLTHGDLPHEALWTAWMREARGLLPRGSLAGDDAFCLQQCDAAGACEQRCGRAAACNPLCVDALQRRLGPDRSPAVLQQQHLFTVYVHARPTLKDYDEESVFGGRLIPDRIVAKWGTHSLAAAAKKLVEAAVLDQRNEWFVLVGDTTVPLYHPAMMWQQLTHGSNSRLNACWAEDKHLMRRRYTPDMRSDRFQPYQHWRKSSQWFTLNRKHADLLAHDQEVSSLFSRHCQVGWDEQQKRHRDCISDEHYLPSLLAMYGLDNETSCDMSGGTFASWEAANDTKAGGHPKTFQPGHVTPELIASMRQTVGLPAGADKASFGAEPCAGWAAAAQAAREAFIDVSRMSQERCPATLGSLEYLQQDPFAGAALDHRCVLLARKFSQPAAKWVERVYRSCSAGLGVLPCDPALTDADNHWWA